VKANAGDRVTVAMSVARSRMHIQSREKMQDMALPLSYHGFESDFDNWRDICMCRRDTSMVGAEGAEWNETLVEICNSESDTGDQFSEWYGPRSSKIMVENEDETTDKRVVRIEERLGDGDGKRSW